MKRIIISSIIAIATIAGIIFVLNKNQNANAKVTEIVAQKNTAVTVRAEVAENRELNLEYITNGVFFRKTGSHDLC